MSRIKSSQKVWNYATVPASGRGRACKTSLQNVGARKERNIRDNIFVINAVMNSIRKGDKEPVDFQVYNVEKCFDTLWLH